MPDCFSVAAISITTFISQTQRWKRFLYISKIVASIICYKNVHIEIFDTSTDLWDNDVWNKDTSATLHLSWNFSIISPTRYLTIFYIKTKLLLIAFATRLLIWKILTSLPNFEKMSFEVEIQMPACISVAAISIIAFISQTRRLTGFSYINKIIVCKICYKRVYTENFDILTHLWENDG